MALFGAFSSSVLGMLSQSRAMNTISNNIANVTTGGFKGSETRFATLVGTPLFNESDLTGPKPYEYQRISQQGLLQSSEADSDLAINGNGFFVLSKTFAVDTNSLLYGRDGAFDMKTLNDVSVTADDGSTITVKDGYLIDKNGYYVLGWEPDTDGTFPTSNGTLTPLRIDPYAFTDSYEATSTASLTLNLPANGDANSTNQYGISVVDSNGDTQPVTLKFYKSHVANQWIVYPATDGTGTTQADTVTLGGTPEAGDQYSVTVNNSAVSYKAKQNDTVTLGGAVEAGDQYTINIDGTDYTVTAAGGESLNDLRDSLISTINGANLGITASADTSGTGIVALSAEKSFTTTASATNGGLTADNTATAATTTESLTDIQGELVTLLNNNTAINGDVTAAASGTAGITLTATAAATPFSTSATAVNNGSTDDNTATYTTNASVLTFSGDGYLTDPSDGSVTLAMDFSGGSTASVAFDMSQMTQFDGTFTPESFSANGYASSRMSSYHFDNTGQIVGDFEDSTHRTLYKIPLATFTNPNGLEAKNGNVYVPSDLSGDASIVAAGTEAAGTFQPNSRELSNVDIADEFTKMIVTQQAYNSSATVFKTLDEITQTVRDLKR